ncbi:hypothetical protein [Nonomuraea sp. NPDC050643]|uniref:hypothetical protein n=1 Tax=Nonomuraea sp. NPDC050643 TaxID=3155660 RepID=UPI0033F1C775
MRALADAVDWIDIAQTPGEAREIVAVGHLALVPGLEVDAPGGWHTEEELRLAAEKAGVPPATLIARLVADLYAKGIRHMFITHGPNGWAGGSAMFVRTYDASNHLASGRSFAVESAPPSSASPTASTTTASTAAPSPNGWPTTACRDCCAAVARRTR